MHDTLVKLVRQLCPPLLFDALQQWKRKFQPHHSRSKAIKTPPEGQDLDIYWHTEMAQILETWGEGNVWNEIQLFLVNCHGKVLDLACGTGKSMEVCAHFPHIELYGLDISDFLIGKAKDRGIPPQRLSVCDATKTPYKNDFFNFAYSIGSLEHFTEEGIGAVISECYRIARETSFHLVPVSRSSKNEGWITPYQSYFNNSIEWWLDKFQTRYDQVFVLNSSWCDDISLGKWFVCKKSPALL